MKTLVFLTSCFLLTTFVFSESKAQTLSSGAGKIEVISPVFPGVDYSKEVSHEKNISVLNRYLHNNIIYPESAVNCCLQGTEVVKFTVLPTGDLENIKVINSVCPKIDSEVIRVLKTTNGMWTPGTNNGVPVAMEKEILIVFHLEGFHAGTDNEYFIKKATNWYQKGNRALFEQKNPEKALNCYNNALKYRPLEDALLYARGIVKYELNDIEGANEDWNRVKSLVERNENDSHLLLVTENFRNFSGYDELLKK